jgi:hypothetical protein
MCCKKPCKCPRSLADYVMQSHGSLTDRMWAVILWWKAFT